MCSQESVSILFSIDWLSDRLAGGTILFTRGDGKLISVNTEPLSTSGSLAHSGNGKQEQRLHPLGAGHPFLVLVSKVGFLRRSRRAAEGQWFSNVLSCPARLNELERMRNWQMEAHVPIVVKLFIHSVSVRH